LIRRRYLLFLAVLIAVPTATFVIARSTSHSEVRPTLAELAAKNYRTLSVAESRRLLRYAETEYRCIAAHGAPVAAPVASRTRITMSAPGHGARELLGYMTTCDPEVGPPPPGASLQTRPGLVLVYVPKRCLLDPTAITSTA
jgi:hypothetical protein